MSKLNTYEIDAAIKESDLYINLDDKFLCGKDCIVIEDVYDLIEMLKQIIPKSPALQKFLRKKLGDLERIED